MVLTNAMHVALHACREIVVNHFANAFEIHAPRHDLGANHDPTLAFTHTADSVLALLSGHSRVQTVHVCDASKHKLFRQ